MNIMQELRICKEQEYQLGIAYNQAFDANNLALRIDHKLFTFKQRIASIEMFIKTIKQ